MNLYIANSNTKPINTKTVIRINDLGLFVKIELELLL